MSDQPTSGNNSSNNNPNNRHRHNNNRRRPHGPPNPNRANPNNERPQGPGHNPQAQNQNAQANREGQQNGPQGNSQRKRPHKNNHNRPRNPNSAPANQQQNNVHGINIERIYEKYLNLLDQHLIARRKYHDLFYRADPGQKNKLERNFYNTLNDIRDFESKLAPDARILFEKRNNGLNPDNIYTTNHDIPVTGDGPPPETEWHDPHFLQTQKLADFQNDKEESVGSLDDYLRYKNLN